MPPVKNMKFGKPKNAGRTIRRLLGYMGRYKFALIAVAVMIACSSLVSIVSTFFASILIDKYIEPNIGNWAGIYPVLLKAIVAIGAVFLSGALLMYAYNRIMTHISTRTLKRLRDDMFTHMQTLPISYFDTHTHGELMSRYTNDVDVIREMLSGTFTQLISSLFNIVGVLVAMIMLSPVLTLIIVGTMVLIIFFIRTLMSKSGANFRRQQKAVGDVNGYIEEMIDGQRVVKVFCHEPVVKQEFGVLNEELRSASCAANTYANILMPIMGNLSHIIYAIIAIAGSTLIIAGKISMGVGALVSFLLYIRQFFNPITQVSQQMNAILSGLAGAERIFDMLDEKSESDEGYVELVNAVIDENGNITETTEKTGCWAWKHPHGDGTITYTRLEGKVELENVTFGYVPDKIVLKDLSLYVRRLDRRGKNDDYQPYQPFLRYSVRKNPLRRNQHNENQEGRPSPFARYGASGHASVYRYRPRKRAVRKA